MKRTLLIFLLGGVLGVVAGAGGMLVAFPFLFPPPVLNETVAEATTQQTTGVLIGEAMFRTDSPGQDPVHWGRGGIKLYRAADDQILLALQKDFKVGPGPNFWIYLNTQPDIDDEQDFRKDEARIKLTKLKGFEGAQVYTFSAAQLKTTRAVTIWCETFSQYIASANLPDSVRTAN